MKKKSKPAKKVPLGKPEPLTDEQLDAMAIVTPEDIERAKAWSMQFASPLGKALLSAEKSPESEDA